MLASFRKDTRGMPKSTGRASAVLMKPHALVKCFARMRSRASIFKEYRKLPSPRPYVQASRHMLRYSVARASTSKEMETTARES